MANEYSVKDGHRYLVQLSIMQDHYLYDMWDYVQSVKTLREAKVLCEGLQDKTVHKLQIADIETNTIIAIY